MNLERIYEKLALKDFKFSKIKILLRIKKIVYSEKNIFNVENKFSLN